MTQRNFPVTTSFLSTNQNKIPLLGFERNHEGMGTSTRQGMRNVRVDSCNQLVVESGSV